MTDPAAVQVFGSSETESVDRPAAALITGACTHVDELREVLRVVELHPEIRQAIAGHLSKRCHRCWTAVDALDLDPEGLPSSHDPLVLALRRLRWRRGVHWLDAAHLRSLELAKEWAGGIFGLMLEEAWLWGRTTQARSNQRVDVLNHAMPPAVDDGDGTRLVLWRIRGHLHLASAFLDAKDLDTARHHLDCVNLVNDGDDEVWLSWLLLEARLGLERRGAAGVSAWRKARQAITAAGSAGLKGRDLEWRLGLARMMVRWDGADDALLGKARGLVAEVERHRETLGTHARLRVECRLVRCELELRLAKDVRLRLATVWEGLNRLERREDFAQVPGDLRVRHAELMTTLAARQPR